MDKIKIQHSNNLIRKLHPANLEKNLESISKLIKDSDELSQEILGNIEHPLKICKDDSLGDFIKSKYNFDRQSFRSPWSNQFYPKTEDPRFPANELREFEVKFNKIYKLYKRMYYSEHAVSSVYINDLGESLDQGFVCCLLIKNDVNQTKGLIHGNMDSINIVNVKFSKEKDSQSDRIKVTYKLNSTLILSMNFKTKSIKQIEKSLIVNKQSDETHYIKKHLDIDFHIEKIGKFVENIENSLRVQLEEVQFKKPKEILENSRLVELKGRQSQSISSKTKELFLEAEKENKMKIRTRSTSNYNSFAN